MLLKLDKIATRHRILRMLFVLALLREYLALLLVLLSRWLLITLGTCLFVLRLIRITVAILTIALQDLATTLWEKLITVIFVICYADHLRRTLILDYEIHVTTLPFRTFIFYTPRRLSPCSFLWLLSFLSSFFGTYFSGMRNGDWGRLFASHRRWENWYMLLLL